MVQYVFAAILLRDDCGTFYVLRNRFLQFENGTCPSRLCSAHSDFDGGCSGNRKKNPSLSIEEGSFVAFVGKSGSGKSTLAKILSGIYGGYEGSACLFGIEIKKISRKELHSFVSYISHRDWIFAGTVRDCLLEGKPSASDKKLISALESVNLWDFVRENGGLEMVLREGGSNLSGGQKQRLSIARSLLHDSPVMIFDEATSNIDVESEELILNLIRSIKGKKTVIMISHRKENCVGADKIFEFENGSVIEPVEMTSGATL